MSPDSPTELPRGWRRVAWAVRGVGLQVGAVSLLLTATWAVLVAIGAPEQPLLPQLLGWAVATSLSSPPVLALLNAGRPQGRPVLRLVLSGVLIAAAISTSALPSLFPVITAGTALITLPRHPGVRTELAAAAVSLVGTVALLAGVHVGIVPTVLPEAAGAMVGGALLLAGLIFLRYAGSLAVELSARTESLALEQRRRVRELHHACTHDVLTGLLNRAGLAEAVAEALSAAEPGLGTGVVYLDLDGFKTVNDTFGHAAGDVLLRSVSQRLRAAMRPQDHAARVGGDEFVILVCGQPDATALDAVTARALQVVSQPVDLGSATARVGASAGTAWTEDRTTPLEELLARADRAMYAVKVSRARPSPPAAPVGAPPVGAAGGVRP